MQYALNIAGAQINSGALEYF